MPMLWNILRVSFLASLTGLLVILVLRLQLSPRDRTNPLSTSIDLPQEVGLQGWQFKGSQNLAPLNTSKFSPWLLGRRYQYESQNHPLTVDMRYFVNTGIADVRLWLNHFQQGSIDLEIRQQPSVGYYGLSSDQKNAYLTACIQPKGPSTVTAFQFQNNLYAHNGKLNLLMDWLVGRSVTPLFDDRCLWGYLSTPLNAKIPEGDFRFLEQMWVTWYQWWIMHYPQPSPPKT